MKQAYELSAINGVENTPLLPSYYGPNDQYYNANYGRRVARKTITKRRRKSKFGQKDAKNLAKRLSLKVTNQGRQLSVRQLITKITNSLKSKNDKSKKEKIINPLARRMKVSLTKKGRKRSLLSIWNDIKNAVDVDRVTKKSGKSSSRFKSMTKVRNPRLRRRSTNFGSWWDNTQKTYCFGDQCSYASDLGSGLPYYGDWKPYSSVRGPSFGGARRNKLGLPYDRNSIMMDIPARSPMLPGMYSTNIGGYPSSVSSPYPFVNNN